VSKNNVIAAGLLLMAKDTGRVLLLQRSINDPNDPAAGRWEAPGGRLEAGETPLVAARREWEEEVGQRLPSSVAVHTDWRSGVYQGFVGSVPTEAEIKLNRPLDRRVRNPDGDEVETVAWWKPKDLENNNSILRVELARVVSSKVKWAIMLAKQQIRRGEPVTSKTASVNDLIKNLAATSAGSAMLGAGVGAGAGMLKQVVKPKEERDYARGALLGAGLGAGAGYGVKQLANSDPAIESGIMSTYDKAREAIRQMLHPKTSSLDSVADQLASLTPKQASQLSKKLAVRATVQKAGADAIRIVMNQRAVQAKAAGILDNIKATLADPSTRPYASALIGSGLGAVGGAAKSLLMDDPEERSVLRSAMLGAGIGGIGGGIVGKFTNPGPAVVDPNAPPTSSVPSTKDKILASPATSVLGGAVGAGAGASAGVKTAPLLGRLTEASGNAMKARGGGRVSDAISGTGRLMKGRVGKGLGGLAAGAGGVYLANLLRNSLMDKQSGFASLSGPLGKGYTDRVSQLTPPPKEPKESKAPVQAPPGPVMLNPNGTPVGTQTPAAPTGVGGMPAPPTMPKLAAAGDMLKWISDKWADPTNRAMMGAAGGAAAGSLGMLGAEALSPDKKRRRYLNAALTGALGGAAVGGGLGQLSNLSSGGVPDRDLSEVEANILKTPGGVKQLDKAVQSQTPGPVQNAGKLVGELYDESPALASTGVGAAVHYGTRNNPLLQNFVNKTELAHDPQMAELQKLFAAAQRGGGTASVGGQTKTLSEIGDLITKRTKDIHAGTGARRFAAGRGFRRSLPGLAAAGLTWGGPALVNWMRGE